MQSDRNIAESARPASVGAVLSESFEQYRTYFRFWFIAAACVLIPYLVLQDIVEYHSADNLQYVLNSVFSQIGSPNSAQAFTQSNVPQAGSVVMRLLNSFIVMPLLYGTILHYVTEARLYAAEPTLDEGFSRAVRRLFFVILTLVVVWLVTGLAGVLCVVLVSLVAVPLHAIWLVFAGWLIVACAGIWLATRLAFMTAAVIEERRLIFGAFARSFQLTKRKFWRTFWYFVLVLLIYGITLMGLKVLIAALVHNYVLSSALSGLVSLFVIPFLMLARANIYIDSRIRTDVPDLQTWLDTPSES